jgi:hypothetical protein
MMVTDQIRLESGGRMSYQRIDGVSIADPLVAQQPAYRYDINSGWDD